MTDQDDHALDAVTRAVSKLVPQLSERLVRHGVGEIEVRQGDLRVRVVSHGVRNAGSVAAGAATQPHSTPRGVQSAEDAAPSGGIVSPAVGFFVYADGLGPGLEVGKGDAIGHVEMLGVRHDVRAPRGGRVRNLVAESGEAVEYGQVVAEMDAADLSR